MILCSVDYVFVLLSRPFHDGLGSNDYLGLASSDDGNLSVGT